MIRLYHGSTVNIERIDLAKSKPNKDFGKAFYLSDNYEQAMEMAQFKAEFAEDEFTRRIQYIKGITFQYAFCTQRAINQLIKI